MLCADLGGMQVSFNLQWLVVLFANIREQRIGVEKQTDSSGEDAVPCSSVAQASNQWASLFLKT